MFNTKANTLLYLYDKVTKSHIEQMEVVTGEIYFKKKKDIILKLIQTFETGRLVVRSSSSNEDGSYASNAGHYESVLNVAADNPAAIEQAIETVFDSYRLDMDNLDKEQVLVQRQTEKIVYSGVLFSRDIKIDRPYYVISYDQETTDAVTSGKGGKTIYIARNLKKEDSCLPQHWRSLLEAVAELEEIFPDYPLDIEFAILENYEIVIFQVRPLAANLKCKKTGISDETFFQMIADAKTDYSRICRTLAEQDTILSDMAFWNPAEMIGENPHPLDYSLYREIITKSAWNQGLNYIGYKAVDGELMYRVGNKPYISLKQSFLCLTPEDLEENLNRKLIDYYNQKLRNDLSAHDKIEFEIVLSNYDLSTEDRLCELEKMEFSSEEISDLKSALFNLTNNAICNFKRNRMKDLRALNGLRVHRENIRSNWKMSYNDISTLIQYFVQLLESIKQYGTPKFARQARLAFISKALCRSLAEKGFFTKKEIDDFMMSIYTVASEFDSDFQDYADGKITRAAFDEKYGHLRSGTYDITCKTYAEKQFDTSKGSANARKQRQTIEDLKRNPLNYLTMIDALEELGFFIDARDFVEYLRDSMEEREYFKFEFTKSLSLAIDILIEVGCKMGIDKTEMAYLTVEDIFWAYNKPEELIREKWSERIAQNKEGYLKNSFLILPEIITSAADLEIIEIREARPNFITSEVVSGEVVLLENCENRVGMQMTSELHEDRAKEQPPIDVHGKIVVIPKADPGYDWIFAKGIKGFITKYGGAASHMAIRCAEFNIPAAIGCGDAIYSYVEGLKYVTLDCNAEKILEEV